MAFGVVPLNGLVAQRVLEGYQPSPPLPVLLLCQRQQVVRRHAVTGAIHEADADLQRELTEVDDSTGTALVQADGGVVWPGELNWLPVLHQTNASAGQVRAPSRPPPPAPHPRGGGRRPEALGYGEAGTAKASTAAPWGSAALTDRTYAQLPAMYGDAAAPLGSPRAYQRLLDSPPLCRSAPPAGAPPPVPVRLKRT
jgi:hypothetical protein